MAVLTRLVARSVVLVTTHHGVLKNYGYTHPACVNASVDFDQNTLSPTYRILMGVPGEKPRPRHRFPERSRLPHNRTGPYIYP